MSRGAQRSDLARTAESKEKTGVFTGAYAWNPVWPQGDPRGRVPIWVADYVLMTYGTGAIMAVPAHDTRDFEFAKLFDIPIIAVVMPPDDWLHQQLITRGLDQGYARRHGQGETAEALLQSATAAAGILRGVTGQDMTAVLDGDAGWMRQVGEPTYVALPGLFVEAYTGDGRAINSERFNGLPTAEFKAKITAWLEQIGRGRKMINYKLRDWLFSRQRYWGEPFPILHGPDGELVALDESELPLKLPPVDDYRPAPSEEGSDALPQPPLGRAKSWVTVQRGGKTYRRELKHHAAVGGLVLVLPAVPRSEEQQALLRRGGRAVLDVDEGRGRQAANRRDRSLSRRSGARRIAPALRQILAQGAVRPRLRLHARAVPQAVQPGDDPRPMLIATAGACTSATTISSFATRWRTASPTVRRLEGAVEKMSKSMKNVINPDEVVEEYGADTLRLYEMFMGPLDASKPWNPRDVPGVFRFLQRTWRLIVGDGDGPVSEAVTTGPIHEGLERVLHKTIKKVTDDIERMAFNTAISAMMEFVNEAYRAKGLHKSQAERFVLVLSPFAPHLAEELWQRLRGQDWKGSLAHEPWPTFDAALVVDKEIEVPVQVNGKMVTKIKVPKDASQDDIRRAALADAKVAERVSGGTIQREVYVPGRMLNLVVKK